MSSCGEEGRSCTVTMVDVLEHQTAVERDADAVLGGSDDVECTYSRGYVRRQALYACLTCSPGGNPPAGFCLACSLACHEKHDLVELYTKRSFRCDCGTPATPKPCSLGGKRSALNDLNRYNHNFSGLYCRCERPYPDPDRSVDDDMIQCVICEDWLHAGHLDARVPPNDRYSEMICPSCTNEYSFLKDYVLYAAGDEDTLDETLDTSVNVTSVTKDSLENVEVDVIQTNDLKPDVELAKDSEQASKPIGIIDPIPTIEDDKANADNCIAEHKQTEIVQTIPTVEDNKANTDDCITEHKQIDINEPISTVEDSSIENSKVNTDDCISELKQTEIVETFPIVEDSLIENNKTNTDNCIAEQIAIAETIPIVEGSSVENSKTDVEDRNAEEPKQSEVSENIELNQILESQDVEMEDVKESPVDDAESVKTSNDCKTLAQVEPSEAQDPQLDTVVQDVTSNLDNVDNQDVTPIINSDQTLELNELLKPNETIEKTNEMNCEAEVPQLDSNVIDNNDSSNVEMVESNSVQVEQLEPESKIERSDIADILTDSDDALLREIDMQIGECIPIDNPAGKIIEESCKEPSDEILTHSQETENIQILANETIVAESSVNNSCDMKTDSVPENEIKEAPELKDINKEAELKDNTNDKLENTVPENELEVPEPMDINKEAELKDNNTNDKLEDRLGTPSEIKNSNESEPSKNLQDEESNKVPKELATDSHNGNSHVQNSKENNEPGIELKCERSDEGLKRQFTCDNIKSELFTDDNDEPIKKRKLNEVKCTRPVHDPPIEHKGAIFWPYDWRTKLCTCTACTDMYKEKEVLYLLDTEDTVVAYENLGQMKNTTSQYEKGLEALSSLDRIQQINAITEYNKMKEKLVEFLKTFKDKREVVREEDIKGFFAGMKPKREPDGVYFCR